MPDDRFPRTPAPADPPPAPPPALPLTDLADLADLADGTLVRDSTGQLAVAVGGVLVRFADLAELTACGYDERRVLAMPGRFDPGQALPADGTLVQGRDGQVTTAVAMMVGQARLDFASEAELEAAPARGVVNGVPLPLFRGLPVVPADGTLCRATVDRAGRYDPRPVALLLGGALIAFDGPEEVAACGYQDSTVWTIPSRVYDGFPTELPAGVRLTSPGSGTVSTVTAAGDTPGEAVGTTTGRAWVVPERVLRAVVPRAEA
ncbi:hypothetical protein ACIQWA_29505 [Kitasatospora sp. NPDC098652]|uniref:hypothetical protein n=1 Tax=Kitasatospora sp. NPDC098652 TaxID=3364095 RepID=UPI003801F91B